MVNQPGVVMPFFPMSAADLAWRNKFLMNNAIKIENHH
jgi:hypothetical protein